MIMTHSTEAPGPVDRRPCGQTNAREEDSNWRLQKNEYFEFLGPDSNPTRTLFYCVQDRFGLFSLIAIGAGNIGLTRFTSAHRAHSNLPTSGGASRFQFSK